MFSNALKSFSSNISANYTIAPQPSSTSGPWRIFDAKRKNTGKAVSVFVFDKKTLEPQGGGLGGRGNAASLKRAHEEVIDRLRREASSLARLRHPSVLELVEPVEETRNGGLMFATEHVTASLASLLHEKDEQERAGGVGGRGSRYVVEEQDGTRRRRELEIDELEIQKGLLQLGKGLEFLHESAGLVHANLTPEAVLVNAKGDWKIAGLGFCGPHASSTAATSLAPISLHEVLNHDPRLPKSVQLNLDYSSPDFVLDNQLVASADMFSLGLLVIALYNSPHTSPLSTGGSLSGYKRTFASSSTVPSQSNNFLVPSSNPLPPRLASELLPRLITRRAAQRMSAREFQEASYFDNILVSTIRFLDALPAKTANEKAQFMRGLPRIISQFPRSVLEKKVLPALLDEMKDKELLAPILANVFVMVKIMPTGKRPFTEKVVPKLREVFLAKSNAANERDTGREAGLMVILENMQIAAENCPGKEFREDILPILELALESPTHGLVDAALGTLPHVLPVLDFSTIKNELFPVIATGFAKTSSLAIKVRGLEAICVLCGGSNGANVNNDDLNGLGDQEKKSSTSSSAMLDKFTVQEKVVPLLKGIKTKEPGVMMAALKVFKKVGQVADTDFLAMEVLPLLWAFSLGPLLDLQQFEVFMELIRSLSGKIEREHTRKLREMSRENANAALGVRHPGVSRTGSSVAFASSGLQNSEDVDFAALVSGRNATKPGGEDLMNDWGAPTAQPARPQPNNGVPTFAWQTTSSTAQPSLASAMGSYGLQANGQSSHRAITPDQTLSSFATLTPSMPWSQPLQPTSPSVIPLRPAQPLSATGAGSQINWAAASKPVSVGQTAMSGRAFGLPPPPTNTQRVGVGVNGMMAGTQPQAQPGGPKKGLDQYESLL
ncbi:hypothetical protein B0A48_02848 [Cryoendolithus antarcticus]|uniref:Protein kinase domain-containing protein n=1 Tax=Cryoendolithus antarcticus TaxID=1507870 RepID=A0A1V8TLF7_9PEZI|nr:hypothetical protein B0A48_02848 [Cryoendolithus antarcticus]